MSTPQELAEWNRLLEDRQAVYDERYDLLRKPRPRDETAARRYDERLRRLESRLDALDKQLNKNTANTTKTRHNWRSGMTAHP